MEQPHIESSRQTSEKQSAANRANSQHSTGPRTDEGKARTRLNGLRHGLTGRVTLMPWEDAETHNNFCQAILQTLNPAGAVEHDLATGIAEDKWRLNRLRVIETNFLASATEEALYAHPDGDPAYLQATSFIAHMKQLQLFSLYEQRLNRTIERNSVRLEQMQDRRQAVYDRAVREEASLADLDDSLAGPASESDTESIPEPGMNENGSGFSGPQFARDVDRARDLRMAEIHALREKKLAAEGKTEQVRRPSTLRVCWRGFKAWDDVILETDRFGNITSRLVPNESPDDSEIPADEAEAA